VKWSRLARKGGVKARIFSGKIDLANDGSGGNMLLVGRGIFSGQSEFERERENGGG
jgi:hypothetical protein